MSWSESVSWNMSVFLWFGLVGMRRWVREKEEEEEEDDEAWVLRKRKWLLITKFMGPSSKVHGNESENLFLLRFSLSTTTIICFLPLSQYSDAPSSHLLIFSVGVVFRMEMSEICFAFVKFQIKIAQFK